MNNYLTKNKFVVVIAILVGLASGCTEDQVRGSQKRDIGAVLGAVGGAILGSNLGKGHGNVVGIAVGTLAGAAIGGVIGSSLDEKDKNYHQEASSQALEYNQNGHISRWVNPDSGNSGSVQPIRTFQRDGLYCREYRQTIAVGDKKEDGYGTACRQPDGTWKIVN
jgi:surface antigen